MNRLLTTLALLALTLPLSAQVTVWRPGDDTAKPPPRVTEERFDGSGKRTFGPEDVTGKIEGDVVEPGAEAPAQEGRTIYYAQKATAKYRTQPMEEKQCGPGGCNPGQGGGYFQPPSRPPNGGGGGAPPHPEGPGGGQQPPRQPSQGKGPSFRENGVPVDSRLVAASVRVGAGNSGGSGTAVHYDASKGKVYIITCRHVVSRPVTPLYVDWNYSGKRQQATFIAADKTADLALLMVDGDDKTPTVPITDTKGPDRDVDIFQVGYPAGVGPTKRKGRSLGWSGYTATQWNVGLGIQVQGGDSGSGVFRADDHCLCGVLWGGGGGHSVMTGAYDCRRFCREVCCLQIVFGGGLLRPKPPVVIPPQVPIDPNPPPNNGSVLAELAKGKAELAAQAAKIAQLEAQVAALKVSGTPGLIGPQGPAGKDGATGPQGPAGKDGSPGKDGKDGKDGAAGKDGISIDPSMLVGLQTQINLLKTQGFVCELYDGKGNILQAVPFSAKEPLRLKFFQTTK